MARGYLTDSGGYITPQDQLGRRWQKGGNGNGFSSVPGITVGPGNGGAYITPQDQLIGNRGNYPKFDPNNPNSDPRLLRDYWTATPDGQATDDYWQSRAAAANSEWRQGNPQAYQRQQQLADGRWGIGRDRDWNDQNTGPDTGSGITVGRSGDDAIAYRAPPPAYAPQQAQIPQPPRQTYNALAGTLGGQPGGQNRLGGLFNQGGNSMSPWLQRGNAWGQDDDDKNGLNRYMPQSYTGGYQRRF